MSASPGYYGPVGRSADFGEEQTLYHMYLILSQYHENYEPLKHFVQLLENFCISTNNVSLMIPAAGHYTATRNRILAIPWDSDTRRDIEQATGPVLLIVKTILLHFEPSNSEYMLLKFPAALDPAEHGQYVSLFREMAAAIESGDDLLSWRRTAVRKQETGTLLRRLYDSIELKPGAFGCSIDLKKLIVGK